MMLQTSWAQTDPKLSRTIPIQLRLRWHVNLIAQHISHYSYVDERFSARPTNDISIEFEIRPKFEVSWFQMYSTDHNEILHTSQQCNCRDVYVQNFIMISWAYIKLEHSKFLLNFEFDQNTVIGTGPGQLSVGSLLLVGSSCHNDDTLMISWSRQCK